MCRITALNFIKIMSAGIFFVFYFPKYGKIVEDEGEKCQKEKNETDVHPAVIAFHKQNRNLYKKQKQFKILLLRNVYRFISRKKTYANVYLYHKSFKL